MSREISNNSQPGNTRPGHTPVMLREMLDILRPRDGGIYVDGTFGAGGYTRALLAAAGCRVWALDRDPAAVATGAAMAERAAGRLMVVQGCFGDMDTILAAHGLAPIDGVAFDLGVSSMQLDAPERGFSFRFDGVLDMRMAASGEAAGAAAGPSAADLVNRLPERELADIIHHFGEERRARQVARAIVASRRDKPIARTLELADIVRRVVRRSADGLDPATRTFQALRIKVNDELGELERGLRAAERVLAPGGRLVVVSFHRLEDRIVKEFLALRGGRAPGASRHRPEALRPEALRQDRQAPSFEDLFRRALRPDAAECAANPRARSARLRAARRTDAPAWRHEPRKGAA